VHRIVKNVWPDTILQKEVQFALSVEQEPIRVLALPFAPIALLEPSQLS